MEGKVFRFPDGKGGTEFKIMTESGEWIDCDENGVPLKREPSQSPDSSPSVPAKPKDRFVRTPVNVYFTSETIQLLNDFTSWRSLRVHGKASRSEIVQEAVRDFILRDAEFQDFMKLTGHGPQ